MAELSPAAQAVMNAATNGNFNVVNDPVYKQCIAAALRAAVDRVITDAAAFLSPGTAGQIRADFLAIAAELDGINSTSQEHYSPTPLVNTSQNDQAS